MSFGSLVSYIIWMCFSFPITGEWEAPNNIYMCVIFVVLTTIMLITIQSKCYGYITDKRPGSNWLMLPVSTFEKFLSMIINIFIIIPLLFFTCYIGIDIIISLLDPTYTNNIIETIKNPIAEFSKDFDMKNEGIEVRIMTGKALLSGVNDVIITLETFLLGALYFKKNKVVKTILTLIAISIIVSIFTTPFVIKNAVDMPEGVLYSLVNWGLVLDYIGIIGFFYWIYYRIKSIKH